MSFINERTVQILGQYLVYGSNYELIQMILNPIVEINDVAVDTWETFLVTFNTP